VTSINLREKIGDKAPSTTSGPRWLAGRKMVADSHAPRELAPAGAGAIADGLLVSYSVARFDHFRGA